jgi:hypothetical protein
MQTKLIALIAVLVIAFGSLGASAASAKPGCGESRACQPIGKRPDTKRPRVQANTPKLAPKQVGSSGQLWRAGNHDMY